MVRNSLIQFTTALSLLVFWSIAANGQLSDQLLITEIMWDSGSPGANEFGEGGHLNGDWWELTNIGSDPVDLTGFMFSGPLPPTVNSVINC